LQRNKPPYGSKDYEYSDVPQFSPKESDVSRYTQKELYGKAPQYKTYTNYNKQKPYDRPPYDRSPNYRAPSPTRSQYSAGRRGSWDSRAPAPKKYDSRY
jgi:hypothetical protein